MKLRCKPGDLAIVIHDIPECADNIGRLVRIRGPVQYNPIYRHQCWLITPVSAAKWKLDCYERGIHSVQLTSRSLAEHPDAWMVPIRPEELDRIAEAARLDLDRLLATLPIAVKARATEHGEV